MDVTTDRHSLAKVAQLVIHDWESNFRVVDSPRGTDVTIESVKRDKYERWRFEFYSVTGSLHAHSTIHGSAALLGRYTERPMIIWLPAPRIGEIAITLA